MTVFVDTSAYYALLDEDDRHHGDAVTDLRRLTSSDQRFVTSNYVVVETVALLQRRFGMSAVGRFIREILPLAETVWVTPTLHAAALGAFLEADQQRISFVDRVSFEIMRRHDIERAFAFDEDFEAAATPQRRG